MLSLIISVGLAPVESLSRRIFSSLMNFALTSASWSLILCSSERESSGKSLWLSSESYSSLRLYVSPNLSFYSMVSAYHSRMILLVISFSLMRGNWCENFSFFLSMKTQYIRLK
jgi:hypothetical protein